jgi:hypothetical protein
MITSASFKRFIIIVLSLMFFAWPVGYIIFSLNHHAGRYPAKEIAALATSAWREHFHTPLAFVAGNRYITGYVSFYSQDHPSVLIDANFAYSPWVSPNDFRCHGAVFLQDNQTLEFEALNSGINYERSELDTKIHQQYPELIVLPIQSTSSSLIQLQMELLPPNPAYCHEK